MAPFSGSPKHLMWDFWFISWSGSGFKVDTNEAGKGYLCCIPHGTLSLIYEAAEDILEIAVASPFSAYASSKKIFPNLVNLQFAISNPDCY
jgi:hypothetical protein